MSYFEAQIPAGLLASAWLGDDPPDISHPHTTERDWLAKLKLVAMRRLTRSGCAEAQASSRNRVNVSDKPKHLTYGMKHYCIAHHGGIVSVQPAREPRSAEIYHFVPKAKVTAWLALGPITDNDLDRLEFAANANDISEFSEILEQIDWDHKPAEDFVRGIDLALEVGAHLSARELATQGAEIHFDSEELQKYARILAPPQVVRTQPRRVDVLANTEWLKANQSEYKGKWVAIKEGTLVASADSHDELIAGIGETKGRSILVTNL